MIVTQRLIGQCYIKQNVKVNIRALNIHTYWEKQNYTEGDNTPVGMMALQEKRKC